MAKEPKKVPLSENQRKFHPEWTAEDCIAHLRQIAEAHPTQVITRNFFRVHSDISESTWNRFFGTFAEFKRQANITLSRHTHRLEKDIAKHASKDNQRRMTAEKLSYEGKYLKPHGKRFQTTLCVSDLHDINCDPFLRRLFITAVRRIQPEKIVLNGDTFDLPEFSKHFQDPRKFNLLERIAWVHAFLADLREAAPEAEIVMVEGNHEFRLIRHLTEATPAMLVVLADLHGFTVPKLLGLDQYEVNYIARMDLTTFTERDIKEELRKNYFIAHGAVLFHHFPEGEKFHMPGTNGHHHKHLVTAHYSPQFGPYEWHQTGSGHLRNAAYCAAERWSNGFLIIHTDTETKHSAFEYIDVRDFAVMGGVFYRRADGEGVYPKS